MSKYSFRNSELPLKPSVSPRLKQKNLCMDNISPTTLKCLVFLFCLPLSPIMWPHYHPSWAYRSFGHGLTSVSKTELSIKKQLFPAFPPFSVNELICLCELQEFEWKIHYCTVTRGETLTPPICVGGLFALILSHILQRGATHIKEWLHFEKSQYAFSSGVRAMPGILLYIDTGWPFQAMFDDSNTTGLVFSFLFFIKWPQKIPVNTPWSPQTIFDPEYIQNEQIWQTTGVLTGQNLMDTCKQNAASLSWHVNLASFLRLRSISS